MPPKKIQQLELDTLRAQYTSIITQLDNYQEYVDSLQNHQINDKILTKLKVIADKLQPLHHSYNETLPQLRAIDKHQQYDQNQINNQFLDLETDIKFLIDNNTANNMQTPIQPVSATATTKPENIKLRKVEVPSFNGEINSWLPFRDAYQALVHDNNSLSNIHKFYYLKDCLKDSALKLIDNIQVTNDNYKTAWDTLMSRYENKRLLIHNHIKAILDLPVVTKESHRQLRNILDTLTRNLRSLEALGQPVEYWSALIVHIITVKLDNATKRALSEFKTEGDVPSNKEFKSFLKQRCELLETIELNKNQILTKPKTVNVNVATNDSYSKSNVIQSCYLCKNKHFIMHCPEFLKLSVDHRYNKIKDLKLCTNCFRTHSFKNCASKSTCKSCNRKHHSLLHKSIPEASSSSQPNNTSHTLDSSNQTIFQPSNQNDTSLIHHAVTTNRKNSQILLSTAAVKILDNSGNWQHCRVLLDNGAQSNFITESMLRNLKLRSFPVNISIHGINSLLSNINNCAKLTICSRTEPFFIDVSCLIIQQITGNLPSAYFDKQILDIPKDIALADPNFNQPGQIDLLLGASTFWEIMAHDMIRLGPNKPILQSTKFGWLVSGQLCSSSNSRSNNHLQTNHSLINLVTSDTSFDISKFWQIEEPPHHQHFSKQEKDCEKHFSSTFSREPSGKFVVQLPLKPNTPVLGNSKQNALNRFFALERKLQHNPVLKEEYCDFMREYERLGHMTPVDDVDSKNHLSFFLPHHAVLKASSITTKLRVVFDGSAKSDNGVSLNDIQLTGPTVQSELFSIIMKFRQHTIVITADIEKMYRSVQMHPNHRKLQQIFWRTNPDEELKTYTLNTVTYGTTSAPFLATRCLLQISMENANKFPRASDVIKNEFYVDDLLTGGNTIEEVVATQHDVNRLLSQSGFHLRKFMSNCPEVLSQLSIESSHPHTILQFAEHENTKTLGIVWNSYSDTIQYSTSTSAMSSKGEQVTKRIILSTISKIFDPLGVLGPIIILFKRLIQTLWQLKISWDEPVPDDIKTTWNELESQLEHINKIKIPRNVLLPNSINIQLHGFSDASEKAYGACIYIRSADNYGNTEVHLLCAKSRVVPLRQITLPRLELCAALLLAELSQKVRESLTLQFNSFYFWSDSTITLSWIKTESKLYKTFVANRVAQIQELTLPDQWHHVKSSDNPCDVLSRGTLPSQFVNNDAWFKGPQWLLNSQEEWPLNELIVDSELPEKRKNLDSNYTLTIVTTQPCELFSRVSSLQRLKRVMAWCLRFKHNCLQPIKLVGQLTVAELNAAMTQLVKIAQLEGFSTEINTLKDHKPLHPKNHILSLSPFLDNNNVLRVGGRLQKSLYEYSKKHPVLLPKHHQLTKLIMQSEHKRLHHCGPQLLLAATREQFWPIAGKNAARSIVRNCVQCFKANPRACVELMGQLPNYRTEINLPFQITGVDYAGPFSIKDRKGRNPKFIKAYISVFVCLSTKAVHFELVTSLTSHDFLSALHRFISRRGKPSLIMSDNGTNFVGASRELNELYNFLECHHDNIHDTLSQDHIEWKFIPPNAPHFGGLWEAAVKSCKKHLNRILHKNSFTYEEFSTLLCQIEAILNSRPICPLSNDPTDLEPLTPAHFLVGRPLTALPHQTLTNINENRLSLHQKIQALMQSFWLRWSQEYVSELQTRVKWKQHSSTLLQPGAMVIIKDDGLPPQRWRLGRITKLYPGDDGRTRVVDVQVPNGIIKRPITKVCVLPMNN